ncbi:MAG TPA: dephospho-CoA kinase [Candidatus Acidoferrales bacterium]
MLRVGLTGGIACGKSTVAAMMRDLGCHVIEADALAHRLIEPGKPAYDEVVRGFGRQILLPDGRIDRFKLAGIVFADPERLSALNRIVHPRVVETQEAELEELQAASTVQIAVVEAALLIEAGYHLRVHRLVVAWCRPEQQMERLLKRGLTQEQAAQRIASQIPLEDKKRLAHDLIDCSGPLDETRRQVIELVERLRAVNPT